jgi:hypothetical protein
MADCYRSAVLTLLALVIDGRDQVRRDQGQIQDQSQRERSDASPMRSAAIPSQPIPRTRQAFRLLSSCSGPRGLKAFRYRWNMLE